VSVGWYGGSGVEVMVVGNFKRCFLFRCSTAEGWRVTGGKAFLRVVDFNNL